jgi:hypothetical protein
MVRIRGRLTLKRRHLNIALVSTGAICVLGATATIAWALALGLAGGCLVALGLLLDDRS